MFFCLFEAICSLHVGALADPNELQMKKLSLDQVDGFNLTYNGDPLLLFFAINFFRKMFSASNQLDVESDLFVNNP